MKQVLKTKKTGRRVLAALLSVIMILSVIPVTAFAWGEGESASSTYGDYYIGSDGSYYYYPAPWYAKLYRSDQEYVRNSGGSPYQKYLLTSGNETRPVYCVESGVGFGGDSGYKSEHGTNSSYLQLLPYAAQYGIMLTSLYGWSPGCTLPISGINHDDYAIATQLLIWEYQQQVRVNPHSRQSIGIPGMSADQYYSVIKGRPAEKAYNWILEQIASHGTVPSFTTSSRNNASTYELKYNPNTKLYSLTLTDNNNLNIDLQTLSGSGVTVTRSGNKYTFTSSKMIEEPITFEYRKNIPISEKMLIWGYGDRQTMLTGAEDPVTFFMKIKTETYGTAKLVKTSEDGIVEGIDFTISGYGETYNVTTGANGTVEKKLLPGNYIVTEVPVNRYVVPTAQSITIASGQTTSFSFSNVLKKFRVEVTKTDAETGTAQGDSTLAGAKYGLYKGGVLVDTYTTDAGGQFTTSYYICDTDWTMKEIEASEGYLLDTTSHPVGADPKLYTVELNTTSNAVTEQVIKGNVRLIKHTDDWDPDIDDEDITEGGNTGMIERPEAGAKFEIFLLSSGSYEKAKESERDILVTDEDGMAISKDLPYGLYRIRQLEGEDGKAFVPDFSVFINSDGKVYSYILNNSAITGRVRIEKHDIESGNIIPAAGIAFQIRDKSTGELVVQRVWYPTPVDYDTYYTSDEGWLMLPDELPAGDYELIEVETAYGYVLNSEPVPFTIDGTELVTTVIKSNIAQKGRITVYKEGEVFASVEENEGVYQPVYEVRGLAEATYDIYADEDIYTRDGTLRVEEGELVSTVTTDESGAATTSELLYLGRYRIIERTAPELMVLSTEEILVELTYAGQLVEVTTADTSVYNERQKVEIELLKIMETDELFEVGDGEEMLDVTFGLFAGEELVATDGSMIPKDGLVEMISLDTQETDSKGYGSFDSDLPVGSYYVKEIATNYQYVISDTEFPVLFEYQGQETAVVYISVNDGEEIENRLIRGRVEGHKIDEDGEALEGAVIGLFSPDIKEFTKENALMVTQSDEEGHFAFENIIYGYWIIREIEAPEGFVLNEEFHHIYVTGDQTVISVSIENTRIRGHVQLTKVDADYPDNKLTGAEFELYEDTNGNGELDDEDTLLGILDEIDTGIYEERNLLYGGYFVKETKAPEGFLLDENAYYFAIVEDNAVVTVENEAGVGFINQAMCGSLRISKTSSDGRKEGFSFRIEGENYDKTFTTDADGIIYIEKLRIGTYVITELKNEISKGYILPDPVTVEILHDETLEVDIFNDKVTVTSVPKTGDNANIWLWIGILIMSSISVAGSVMIMRRRRKRSIIQTENKKH